MNVGEIAPGSRDPVDHANRFAINEIDPLVAVAHCRQVLLGHEEAGLAVSTDQLFANLFTEVSALIPVYS